ncbi:MAG: c-type cytochrome domain-containing protein [Gemmataceae bacterium]
MKLCITLVALGLLALPTAAQPAREDLAIHARALLRKHCGECHGATAKPGELSVLDRAGVERFVTPRSAEASYLLHLVEDGSMPPGTQPKLAPADVQLMRDWIDAGAPAYPKRFGNEYAADQVAQDADRRADGENAFYRYLSLAHLVGDDGAPLQPKREALRQTVRDLSRADGSAVVAVDPANTVFRIDLRQLGWDQQPFEYPAATDRDKPKPAKGNLFDLILLEYPDGRVYSAAKKFVVAAGQVAPIAFLDGDWLARNFTRLPAAGEFRRLFRPDERVRPAEALPPPPRFRREETRDRILPFDGLSCPNVDTDPAPFRLRDFETQDAGQKSRTKFKLRDKFVVFVKCDGDIWAELVRTDAFGQTAISTLQQVGGGMGLTFRPQDDAGYELVAPGSVTITLFASKQQFPTGRVLRDKRFQAWLESKGEKNPFAGGFVDRVVHRFYTSAPGDFDPASVVKKTITIEVSK